MDKAQEIWKQFFTIFQIAMMTIQYFEETRTFLKRKKDRKIVACCTQIEQLKNECGNSVRGLVFQGI